MTKDQIHIGTAVRRLILHHLPASHGEIDLHDSVDLFGNALGLDSVAVFEVLAACEAQFNIPFPADLLERPPLTVGRLVAFVREKIAENSSPHMF